MSRWTRTYEAHPFHLDWSAAQESISTSSRETSESLDVAQEFARLLKVMAFVGSSLENCDPEMVSTELLGRLHSQVPSLRSEVSAYVSNKNINHLVNANSILDGMMGLLAQSPMAPYGSAKASLTKAAIAYQEAISGYATGLKATVDAFVSDAKEQLAKLQGEIADAESTLQKIDARIEAMNAQLPTQLSGYNTAFQQSESTRLERFDKWVEGLQARADAEFSLVAKKYGAGIEALTTFQDQAETVLGTVIDTAQAGAYAKYAAEEQRSANLYRRLAIAMMVAAAGVLFLPEISGIIKSVAGYQVDWQKALSRLPFSLVLFAPAIYLARESSRHRVSEVVNRRRQHILTTIGPYLALLPDEKANEIKADVARSIFSDGLPATDEKGIDAAPVLAQLASLVESVMKRRGG